MSQSGRRRRRRRRRRRSSSSSSSSLSLSLSLSLSSFVVTALLSECCCCCCRCCSCVVGVCGVGAVDDATFSIAFEVGCRSAGGEARTGATDAVADAVAVPVVQTNALARTWSTSTVDTSTQRSGFALSLVHVSSETD